MKQFALFVISILFLLSFAKGMITAGAMQNSQEKLIFALENSERHALRNACIYHDYAIKSDKELYADFLSEFVQLLDDPEKVTIRVYEVGLKEGILDIEVEEELELFGMRKSRKVRRTCRVSNLEP